MTNETTPTVEQLVGPGGPYELIDHPAQGTTYRFFKNAPPNLREYLQRSAEQFADLPFFVYENERYSYAETWQLASRVANRLQELGIRKGDRVGIAMRNYPEWLFSFMGIVAVGGVAVALNAWWTREELSYGIEDSGMKLLFVDNERLARIDAQHKDLIVVAARSSSEELAQAAVKAIAWQDFLPAPGAAMPVPAVELEDNATIIYTSGSTAHPKGVLSTQRAVLAALIGFEAGAAIRAIESGVAVEPSPHQEAMILTGPLFHTQALIVQALGSWRSGRKLVGMYKWDAEEALKIVERERITHFHGVPTMAWEMVQSPNFGKYDLSSLKSMGGGGAAMAPEQARKIQDALPGGAASAGYGMTETNSLTAGHAGPALAARPRSCGRPLPPLVSVKVVDEAGNELPRGEIGEIWIKGAMNFSGYWNKPEDTAQTLTDGWVHSGDLGYMDDEDFIYITDRAKDMVIRGGENIACQEVEAVIYEHPAVLEVAVFGVPDERLGERLAAAVMVKPEPPVSADDIQRHVGEHLARFKVPEFVWLQTEQLPRIASGKIDKRGLRAAAVERLAAQTAS